MTEAAVILLVEDNNNDVMLLQRAFNKTGARGAIHAVTDGDAAVAYLAGEGIYADRERYPFPHLLLLDLKLPRRSGHEVLGWLRKREDLKRIPVIMLTSSREREDIDQAYDLGANSYLVKPMGFDELMAMVKSLDGYWMEWNDGPEIKAAG
ncbi:MAG: response regulator [Gemmatimonadales bacterium]